MSAPCCCCDGRRATILLSTGGAAEQLPSASDPAAKQAAKMYRQSFFCFVCPAATTLSFLVIKTCA
jgi:hypothetical protein